jgi:hypothetical protein
MDKAMESRKRSQLISMTLSAKLTDHRKLGRREKPANPLCATLLIKKQAAMRAVATMPRRHEKRSSKAPCFAVSRQ